MSPRRHTALRRSASAARAGSDPRQRRHRTPLPQSAIEAFRPARAAGRRQARGQPARPRAQPRRHGSPVRQAGQASDPTDNRRLGRVRATSTPDGSPERRPRPARRMPAHSRSAATSRLSRPAQCGPAQPSHPAPAAPPPVRTARLPVRTAAAFRPHDWRPAGRPLPHRLAEPRCSRRQDQHGRADRRRPSPDRRTFPRHPARRNGRLPR